MKQNERRKNSVRFFLLNHISLFTRYVSAAELFNWEKSPCTDTIHFEEFLKHNPWVPNPPTLAGNCLKPPIWPKLFLNIFTTNIKCNQSYFPTITSPSSNNATLWPLTWSRLNDSPWHLGSLLRVRKIISQSSALALPSAVINKPSLDVNDIIPLTDKLLRWLVQRFQLLTLYPLSDKGVGMLSR